MPVDFIVILSDLVIKHGVTVTMLGVMTAMCIKLEFSARKDRRHCETEVSSLHNTIQEIRKDHDSDINALISMHAVQRKEWHDSIRDITERVMGYLEDKAK